MKRNMKNRALAWILAAVMVAGSSLGSTTVAFAVDAGMKVMNETETTVVEVSIIGQSGGYYLNGRNAESYSVSSDTAENMGYTDQVVSGVSVLDALVAYHQELFGEEYTAETKDTYLAVSEAGCVSVIFKEATYANGFLLNKGYPNDGTESDWGGYNGTTVNTTVIHDGDVIDFLIYADDACYSDLLSYVYVPEVVTAGSDFEVTVKGVPYMMGYMYEDADALEAAAEPVEGVELCWVDDAGNLYQTGVTTGEDGTAVLSAPEEAGTYYLTARTYEQGENTTYAFLNAAEVTSIDLVSRTVTTSAQAEGAYMAPPANVEVSSDLAESYGYTDTLVGEVSTLDVLVAQTEIIFGDSFTVDTKDDYLAVSDSGWITTIFGEETGAASFRVNQEMPMTVINATAVADGDVIQYYLYTDRIYYTDRYSYVAVDDKITAGVPAEVAVTYEGYDSDWNMVLLPMEGAAIGILDMETGLVTEVEGAVTDEDGKTMITIPEAGEYYITAFGTDDSDSQIIMNPVKITAEDAAVKEAAVKEAADKAAAEAVEAQIEAIGTVTLDSKDAIEAARTAYDALTDDQKARVSADSVTALETAESTYAVLKAAAEDAANGTPAATSITKLTNTASGVQITWSKAEKAGGYILYKQDASGEFNQLATIKAGATVSYVDKTAANGKSCFYIVKAYNVYNGKTYYGEASEAKGGVFVAAGSITKLTNAAKGLQITWKKNSAASGYILYKRDASGTYKKLTTIKSNATVSYVDTKAANGKNCSYKIQAYCKESGVTYNSALSAAKGSVFVKKAVLKSVTSKVSRKVTVTWTKNAAATAYQIRYTINGKTKTVKVSAGAVTKTLTKLTSGKYCSVKVRSVVKVKTTSYYGAWSDVIKVKVKK